MESSNWARTRLGELIHVKHGWPFKSKFFAEYEPGLPIVVNIGNFQYTGGFRFYDTTLKGYVGEFPQEHILKPGDILLVMTCQTAGGEILGIPGRIPNDGRTYLHNQRMGKVIITAPEDVDKDFLYWLFLTPEFNRELFVSASGTKILHTAPKRIEAYQFPLPPLAEQRAIARILGALDDKIELNRQTNQTLEAMASALFKSWFVDFDPVRALEEGRQPAYMDEATARLFPHQFEESVLGEIPKGWRVGTLGEVAENPRRGVKPENISFDTPYIGLEHMPRRSIALADWGNAAETTSNKFQFYQGDILFGKLRPYFHKVGAAPIDGICSTDILVIISKSSEWFGFVLSVVSSAEFIGYTNAVSTGTRMPRTNWEDMSKYELVFPPIKLAQSFNSKVVPIIQKIRANILESQTLANIRDTLLPKLMSGEIRVKEAEKQIEINN